MINLSELLEVLKNLSIDEQDILFNSLIVIQRLDKELVKRCFNWEHIETKYDNHTVNIKCSLNRGKYNFLCYLDNNKLEILELYLHNNK